MFLQKPGRDTKDELKSPLSLLCDLLNCGYFRNPEVREANLAASEIPAVVLQPGVRRQISGVENRNPVAILEAACPYENHATKIGEDLVKIKQNLQLQYSVLAGSAAVPAALLQGRETVKEPARRQRSRQRSA